MNNYYLSLTLRTIIYIVLVNRSLASPIVGGQPIPKSDKAFTFAVSLQLETYNETTYSWYYKHFCGGILIHYNENIAYVLTASHCVMHIERRRVSVIFGAKDLTKFSGFRYTNISYQTNSYDPYTLVGDISMLKVVLNEGDEKYLNPIRMIVDETTATEDNCYIYGYGSETLYGPATLELRLAPVSIISPEKCMEKLGPYNAPTENSRMFCAVGLRPYIDACGGDSGSGLICVHNHELSAVGIISYGLGCGVSGIPGVYTSIAQYADFIQTSLLSLSHV